MQEIVFSLHILYDRVPYNKYPSSNTEIKDHSIKLKTKLKTKYSSMNGIYFFDVEKQNVKDSGNAKKNCKKHRPT